MEYKILNKPTTYHIMRVSNVVILMLKMYSHFTRFRAIRKSLMHNEHWVKQAFSLLCMRPVVYT